MLQDILTYARIKPAVHQIEVHPVWHNQYNIDFCHKEVGFPPTKRPWTISLLLRDRPSSCRTVKFRVHAHATIIMACHCSVSRKQRMQLPSILHSLLNMHARFFHGAGHPRCHMDALHPRQREGRAPRGDEA